MNKWISAILILIMVLSMAACGSSSGDRPGKTTEPQTEPTVNELEQIRGQLADVQWTLEDGVLTISGVGAMPDYVMRSADNDIEMEVESPWFDRRLEIESLVIEEGITYVGAWAFSACDNLTEVSFPGTLIGFGRGAMGGNSIQQIVFPDHIKYLGEGMMAGCEKLEKLTIGSGVKTIPYAAFYKCHFLQEVQLSVGLQVIGEDAFYECKQLHTIHFPESLVSIGESAFCETWNLRSVKFPDGLARMDSYCFYHSGLEELVLPQALKVIREDSYVGCENLKKVTLPAGLEQIEKYAFFNCTNLEEVVFSGTAQQWAEVKVNTTENGLFLRRLHENLTYAEDDIVSLVMDYHYTGGMYGYEAHYRIPKLNMDGNDAAAINDDITDTVYTLATDCVSRVETDGWSYIGSVDCRYKISDGILSLKVHTKESESAIEYYYGYAVRLSDGAELNKWDVLDIYGIDGDGFERKLTNAINAYLDKRGITLDDNMLEKTLDPANLDASIVYIGEDLEIEVVVKMFVPAGAGYQYIVLSI